METEIVLQKLNELTEKVNNLVETLKRYVRNDDEWIDGKETMRILRCSERTLQTLRDNGSLSYSKPCGGTKFAYRIKDVMSLFEKNFNGKV
jgi:hypothetical protein